jgi:nucleoside-diphosphate-sugar epimerase
LKILIVGASGNLGGHIARHLLMGQHQLCLSVHRTSLPSDLAEHPRVSLVSTDLDKPESLSATVTDIDCIVYAAGVLFRPRPESFLPRTNTVYVRHLVDAATSAGVKRFVLISFPHVEENTTPDSPASGRLDVRPRSIHARTRLDAEKYLFGAAPNGSLNAIVLRAGVIYGPDMKLIRAARTLMRYKLLAVWNRPTWIHLLALPDFLRTVEIAVERDGLHGIYNICDDCPVLLQEFLDTLATHWGLTRPHRIPAVSFKVAAALCEVLATLFRTRTPLTRDMIAMAMTSVVADTSRVKRELRQELQYPSFKEGLAIL